MAASRGRFSNRETVSERTELREVQVVGRNSYKRLISFVGFTILRD